MLDLFSLICLQCVHHSILLYTTDTCIQNNIDLILSELLLSVFGDLFRVSVKNVITGLYNMNADLVGGYVRNEKKKLL